MEEIKISLDTNQIIQKVQKLIDDVQENNTRYNEKLTMKDIEREYGIGQTKVWKMFQDKELPVQTYCRPQFVLRGEFQKYLKKRHDYLCN